MRPTKSWASFWKRRSTLVNRQRKEFKDITERVLRLAEPLGATEVQKAALRRVIGYGKENGVRVEVIEVP